MASYERYFNHLIQKAKSDTAAYVQQRRRKADEDAEEIRREYRQAELAAVQQGQQAIAQTEAEYRKAYDANAVSEAVARRNAKEALANSQLINSGLQATQQTAISLVRAHNDSDLTLRKQTAVANIMRELDAERAQYRRRSAEEASAVYKQAQKEMQEYETAQTTQAQKQAQAMQDADVKAAKQAADLSLLEMKANLEARAAAQEAAQKAEKHAAEMALLELKAAQTAAREQQATENGHNDGKEPVKSPSQTNEKDTGNNKESEKPAAQDDEKNAANDPPSKKTIDAQAATKRQNEGNLAAWTYLRKCMSEGWITPGERQEIMLKNNIREPQTLTYEYVDAMTKRMIRDGHYEDARLFLNTIIKNELIDPALISEAIREVFS